MLSSMTIDTLEGRMDQDTKVRENLLRRMAERQGLALRKSRTRDPRALDYDRWMIVDLTKNSAPVGVGPTGKPSMTLNEVEANLMGDDA
jgi:hypothetical protein